MDKVQGDKLADLATTPRLAVPHYGNSRFLYWRNNPDELERSTPCIKGSSKFLSQAVVESRIDRVAVAMKRDLERITSWLERYEAYKEEFVE